MIFAQEEFDGHTNPIPKYIVGISSLGTIRWRCHQTPGVIILKTKPLQLGHVLISFP